MHSYIHTHRHTYLYIHTYVHTYVHMYIGLQGPSIKYVTLFLANFDPPPLSHFVTHPGTPPKVRHTSRTPRFLVGLVQKSRTKVPCTNSISIVRGGFCPGVLPGLVFVRSLFCHNTYVTTES